MIKITLILNIGRRVPKSWFRRQANKAAGLLTFQENIWQMIKQSMRLARKKATTSGKIKFTITFDRESEDLHYYIEWMKVMIQGTEEQEKEEYEEALQMYKPFNTVFKKELPKDERLNKQFKTKMMSPLKLQEAYEKGYGSVSDNNISNKLLEMGIITHIEWNKDFDTRKINIEADF